MSNIRNFAIIAHIDHGKSTLADRFLELAKVVQPGKHEEQLLDRNPISRERGITIKLAPVQFGYKEHILNLIDTPGHVDFSYEVDRTLSCVEGVILLVDATKGIQAQTISNAYKALEKNLSIIPVVNKIDLAHANIESTKQQMVDFLGVKKEDIKEVSAKSGKNVEELLDFVLKKIPAPTISKDEKNIVKALIFDSYYDSHRGVIAFVRVMKGEIKKGADLELAQQKVSFQALDVGIFTPDLKSLSTLSTGEIGYVATNLKDIHKVRVGDTIQSKKSTEHPLSGYKKAQSMVYASIFTTDTQDYLNLKKALEKLYLNDSSLEFSGIYSRALGAGFRVGFLGLLHADVVRERLEREYGLHLVLTPPQVEYKDSGKPGIILEPYVKLLVVTPPEYMPDVMRLCEEHRGIFITMDNKNQITLTYEMPLSEMISNFFDRLKSISSGYASLDWEFLEYRSVSADKMTILLNGEPIEEFSDVVVMQRAQQSAGNLVKRLKELIPRQQYEVKIQAHYKGKIIASERLSPFRKDVTQKLYGGDRTRKDKLLKKQKAGKKKMKMVGRVEIPKEAFLKLFKRD